MNALLWPNHSSINILGMEIYWYAIIIVFGMMAAFFVISLLSLEHHLHYNRCLKFRKCTLKRMTPKGSRELSRKLFD